MVTTSTLASAGASEASHASRSRRIRLPVNIPSPTYKKEPARFRHPSTGSQQTFGLLFDSEDIGADFVQRSQGLRLVEVPREADFIPDLGFALSDPGIGCVGKNLAPDKRFAPAFLQQRNLFSIPQIGVRLVL